MHQGASRQRNIPALDGLRGLAALAVFGVHFNQVVRLDGRLGPLDLEFMLANGEYAVSLFFTLSGLLLSLPFWRSLAQGAPRPGYGHYLMRRGARILPAYWVCLTLLVVLGGLWRVPGSGVDIGLHYGMLFNYTEFTIFSLNPPFWTLAVEAQFYLLLPLLFVLLGRVAPRGRSLALLVLALGAYAAHLAVLRSVDQVVSWPGSPWLPWLRPHGAVVTHSLLAHLPHFLLGVYLGRWRAGTEEKERLGKDMPPWSAEAVFWGSGVLVGVLLATDWAADLAVPGGRYGLPLVPLLIGAVLLAAPATRGARSLLDSRPLRTLGALSYGLYIYHYPCMLWVDRTLSERGVDAAERWALFGGLALALSLAAAAVSYWAVERPALRWVRSRNTAG